MCETVVTSEAKTQTKTFDVAISGASFAGLALARGLSRALPGIAIALIDRPAAPAASDGRAFAIWAGAQRVLDNLGAWDAIAPHAQEMTVIEITDSALDDGVRPTLMSFDATADDRPAGYMVPARVLHSALLATLEAETAITWMTPAEASAVTLGPALAQVQLADGSTVAASLCVAAEGRGSKLRDAAGIKTVGWAYGQTGIVATVRFEKNHGGVAIQHFLPGGPFAVLPLLGQRACITWSASRDEAAAMMALDDAAFAQELENRIGGRFGAITLVGRPQAWPLGLKLPRDLIATRFALIGDAAHGVHPIAGQGVNLALRDAAALVECVADAMRLGYDAGHGPALERYARWRRFDATMSATLYDGLNRLFSADGAVLRASRGAGLGLVDRIPALKQMIVSEAAGLTGDLPKLMRGVAV